MAVLVVIAYADQGVAEDARKCVQELEDELSVRADQVASVSRDIEGRYHAHTSHSGAGGRGGARWSVFWGPLFSLLFTSPLAGRDDGADLLGQLCEAGLGNAFQDRIRELVKPGTSALLILVERAAPDEAVAALERHGGTVIKTSLSNEELERLRKALRPATSFEAAR